MSDSGFYQILTFFETFDCIPAFIVLIKEKYYVLVRIMKNEHFTDISLNETNGSFKSLSDRYRSIYLNATRLIKVQT